MENVGIDHLRAKLSHLLLQHVKNELPRLHTDLEGALTSARMELKELGDSRSTLTECRVFLAELNMSCHELCKAALGGYYDQDFFQFNESETKLINKYSKLPVNRLRAVVQDANTTFSKDLRRQGHKYQFLMTEQGELVQKEWTSSSALDLVVRTNDSPIVLGKDKAIAWAKDVLRRCRGTELVGNFNPRLIAELFWEQSERWERVAKAHIERICKDCDQFLAELLSARAPRDIKTQLW